MNWTPEKDARLRAEWANKDIDTEEIARFITAEFREHVTKNSVIGRAHVLGLPHRRKVPIATWEEKPNPSTRHRALMGSLTSSEKADIRRRKTRRAGDVNLNWSTLVDSE